MWSPLSLPYTSSAQLVRRPELPPLTTTASFMAHSAIRCFLFRAPSFHRLPSLSLSFFLLLTLRAVYISSSFTNTHTHTREGKKNGYCIKISLSCFLLVTCCLCFCAFLFSFRHSCVVFFFSGFHPTALRHDATASSFLCSAFCLFFLFKKGALTRPPLSFSVFRAARAVCERMPQTRTLGETYFSFIFDSVYVCVSQTRRFSLSLFYSTTLFYCSFPQGPTSLFFSVFLSLFVFSSVSR